jgi:hypothetical protein
MMANIPKRQRLLILVAGAGVLLLVLDRIILTPLGDHWQRNAAEIRQLQGLVANGRGMIARSARLNGIWAGIQSASLPADQAQSEHDLISSLEGWGRASGIEIGSIKPLWKRGDTDNYSVLECRVDATGSLSSLSRFLYELGKSQVAARAESIDLISEDNSGQRLTLSLNLSSLRLSPLEDRK